MPDFLGIGAMRAGTSWLAENLRRHPRIWIGRKEQHFFDRHLDGGGLGWLHADRVARARYGVRFLPGALRGRLTGDLTPRYAILPPEVIARVAAWMPEVKLLMMLRDPIERAWSQARHDVPALTAPGTPPKAELFQFFEQPRVRQRGDYLGCLRNWLTAFERRQLWVGFLEEVALDARAVARDALRFLGVEPAGGVQWVVDPVHAAPPAPMPDAVRRHLEALHDGWAAELETLIGRPVPWPRLEFPPRESLSAQVDHREDQP